MIEVNRSGCPYRYNYEHGDGKTYICCRKNKRENSHSPCEIVPDIDCPWALNEKINYLEQANRTVLEVLLNIKH